MKLLYPCMSGGDTQGFVSGKHYGLDFGFEKGGDDTIVSAADGVVYFEGFYDDVIEGKTYRPIGCIIKHDYSDELYEYYSLYTHLASTSVNKGQHVKAGDKIGMKGNTGYSMGKHLHFQVMRIPKGQKLSNWNKYAIDPTPYLYRKANQRFKYNGVFDIPLEYDEDEVIELLKKSIEILEGRKWTQPY